MGTIGGVFTPTLFLGHVLGRGRPPGTEYMCSLLAVASMNLPPAAVTHAPLMATFIAAELTGDWALVPILLPLNLIAWAIARRIFSRALYAIASQSPAHTPLDEPGQEETVQ
jgi:chloride channel protein, CIC family